MKLVILLMTLINPMPKEGTITINKTYDVSSPDKMLIMIHNVHGSVDVEPSSDEKVHLSLVIKIDAPNETLLAQAKKDLKLGEYKGIDSLALYTKAPFIKNCDGPPYKSNWWDNDPGYTFSYEFKVQIPKISSVQARTVNDGDVLIKNILGPIKASNVNGSVNIQNANEVLKASTVNGDITINFLKAPKESIEFNTVNGDFDLTLPEDFAAKIYFQSMNGEMFTAFDYQKLNPTVVASNDGTKYKIGSKTGVEIGSGGPTLSFESISGNVYLRK